MEQRIGKYILEREVARGGMGAVWVALDPDLRRRVALKILRPGDVPSHRLVERFRREALAIAQLHHPNVLQIHDFGVDNGFPFIVMELLTGEDLRARLLRQGRLSIGTVGVLLSQAAKALTAAHGAGIVHRDLKPANLFLARAETGEAVKVLDFGVATILEADEAGPLLARGSTAGTPQFMSPEQATGSPFDHRTDLWSLAVVVYMSLTGRPPFDGPTMGAIIQQICAAPLPSARQVVPTLPAAVDGFFARGLARDPAERFQSARELALAFDDVVETARASCARVLIVDDEPDVETLMKQLFRHQLRSGLYDFTFARSGHEALAQLGEQPDVDVVLSDINMPGMDGLTLLAHVGEVNPVAKTIIVTAYGDMPNIRTAMNRGAFDFLVKPIEVKDLSATLEKTTQQVRTLRGALRAIDENSALRLLAGTGLGDRLLLNNPATVLEHVDSEDATVLFINVFGFPEATKNEAPRAVMQILNDYFEIIVPEVTARDGFIMRLDGRGIMAAFRGPRHAERAIEACLGARGRVRPHVAAMGRATYEVGLAAGVDTGPLTFGGLGSRRIGRIEWTVVGDVVGRAARLRSVAAKDQILIDDRLRRRVEEEFRCEFVDQALVAPTAPHGPNGQDRDDQDDWIIFNVVEVAQNEAPAPSPLLTSSGEPTELPLVDSSAIRNTR